MSTKLAYSLASIVLLSATAAHAQVAPAPPWQPPEGTAAKSAPPPATPAPRKHRTSAKRDSAAAPKSTDALEAEVFGNETTPTVRRPPADDDREETTGSARTRATGNLPAVVAPHTVAFALGTALMSRTFSFNAPLQGDAGAPRAGIAAALEAFPLLSLDNVRIGRIGIGASLETEIGNAGIGQPDNGTLIYPFTETHLVFLEQRLPGMDTPEVCSRLAKDTDKTVAEAKDLWKTVDRPNVLIKIPATEEGLPAITATLAEGISVNVTLIFSVERYENVIKAFFAGLEQAKANGHDLRGIHSVASFFVSRVDTEIDKRLEAIGTDEALALRGKAAVANARLAYAAFEELFASDRWKALAADGANAQRPLWASTGVKNPDYSPTLYVDDLVVKDTVNTMPEKTLDAVAESSELKGDQVTGRGAEAQEVFDKLSAVGIDITDVFLVLENEGVEKFEKSWTELLDTVNGQLEKAKG